MSSTVGKDQYEYEYYEDVGEVPEDAEVVEYVYEDEEGNVYTETYSGELEGVTPAALAGDRMDEEAGDEEEEYAYGADPDTNENDDEGCAWEYADTEQLSGGRYVRGDDGYLYYEYDPGQDQDNVQTPSELHPHRVERIGAQEKEAKGWQGSGAVVEEFLTSAAGKRDHRGSLLVVTGQGTSGGGGGDGKKSGEQQQTSFMAIDNSTLGIDDYVTVEHPKKRKKQIVGKISYIGEAPPIGEDTWVGVSLLEPVNGGCDGSVKGEQFFTCRDKHGVFVRPVDVRPYRPAEEHLVDFILCGFLTKQGKIHRNWKRRFFILTKDYLHYFADHHASKELGKIEIADAKVSDEGVDNKNHAFKVVTKGRTYIFASETAEDAQQWIRSIADAHEIANDRQKMAKEYQKNLEEMKSVLAQRRGND
eukprot:gb/GECH01012755.1/.p1 GENE.gb/GECH01012755.1/~~gb/GECH01012755.1/.p1  ORF type:complete len:418 (+),score=103.16 gb/GECH01012755.1/:1-1254(+)